MIKNEKIFKFCCIILSIIFGISVFIGFDFSKPFNYVNNNDEIMVYVIEKGEKIDKEIYNKKGAKVDFVVISVEDMKYLLVERKYLLKKVEECKGYKRTKNEVPFILKEEVIEHAIKQ